MCNVLLIVCTLQWYNFLFKIIPMLARMSRAHAYFSHLAISCMDFVSIILSLHFDHPINFTQVPIRTGNGTWAHVLFDPQAFLETRQVFCYVGIAFVAPLSILPGTNSILHGLQWKYTNNILYASVVGRTGTYKEHTTCLCGL